MSGVVCRLKSLSLSLSVFFSCTLASLLSQAGPGGKEEGRVKREEGGGGEEGDRC